MRNLFLACVLAVAIADVAPAQYSVEITRRPNSSVTLGPYTSSILSRWGMDTGSTTRFRQSANRGFAGPRPSGVNLYATWPQYIYDYGYTSVYGYGAPFVAGYDYPVWGSPYGYAWPYYLGTGAGTLGPYVAPPVYVPPEQLGFGPQAIQRFMGVNNAQRPIVNQNVIVAPPAANGNVEQRLNIPNNADNAARVHVRESNADARNRARQFLEFGDAQLAAGSLATAYDRYKKAAAAAPDLAEPYFRQGHTLAVMGRYEQSAAAIRRGIDLQPNWPANGFHLADIYRGKDAARSAALAALKQAAEAAANDGNVQFVAGVQFFLDGQAEMARAFLERAKALGESAAYIDPFLKLLPGAGEPAELDI